MLAAVLWAAAPLGALQADDYGWLTLQHSGAQQSVALASVRKITFSGGALQLITAEGTTSYALNGMEKMFFTSQPTPVAEITGQTGVEVAYRPGSKQLTVDGLAAEATLVVYGLNGTPVIRHTLPAGGGTVSLDGLPRGVYVVKVAGCIVKIAR